MPKVKSGVRAYRLLGYGDTVKGEGVMTRAAAANTPFAGTPAPVTSASGLPKVDSQSLRDEGARDRR
jgi:hypothetical protein